MTRTEDSVDDGTLGAEATGPVPPWGWTETALSVMVFVWGVNFAVVKRALETFDPLAFNALRYPIASAFVYVVLRAQGPLALPERRDLPRILVLGVLGNVVYQMAFILGLDRTLAGHASLMLALTPVFTAFLSAVMGHERPGGRTWGGAVLAVGGIALVTGSATTFEASGRVLAGNLILLGASLAWALYTVGARPVVQKYGSVRTTAWTLWVGSVGLVLLGVPSVAAQDWGAVGAEAWGGLLFSAILSIGLAYLIWYRGVERIGNTRTSIFSNLTPVVAMAFGALWLGERPGVLALVGAMLTLGGVLFVRSDPGR
ncbi:MAG TPA: DMT family transporter [Longimicrobiaceae bacterium]|nr:DMT family transporter [Longimicrobiaceae bacterium]